MGIASTHHARLHSNQFLAQEPGTNAEIKEFARKKGFKGVLMDKIDVNGPKASPVYTFLKVSNAMASAVY